MNFQRGRQRAEPEVNLIPLIDVVLVIIIFLMLTTTFSRIATLEINLPEGQAEEAQATADEIAVAITAAGEIIVNGVLVGSRDVTAISETVGKAIPPGNPDPVVVINADAKAEHQSVIDVMQAAQRVGLSHITFSIQMPEQ